MKDIESNLLADLSAALENAVQKAAASTLMVNGRRRLPGSGIAFTSNLVLTADHVVERDEDLSVVLPDGRSMTATLAGRDPSSDLALLRLQDGELTAAKRAPHDPKVGQLVVALGRPNNDGIQVSLGVVSACGGPVRIGRAGLLEKYLRTDAIPYPGFSGGPLVDAAGQVVGVNTSGLARGTSLTIPASVAWNIAEALVQDGQVRRGFLGIRSQPVLLPANQQSVLGRNQETGLLLVGVDEKGPAGTGGMLVGDILVGINGQPLSDPDELLAYLNGSRVGQAVALQVLRGGQPLVLNVVVGTRE